MECIKCGTETEMGKGKNDSNLCVDCYDKEEER